MSDSPFRIAGAVDEAEGERLLALAARLQREASPVLGEGGYAELVDENDPDGMVRICQADGTLVMMLPREDWQKLRASVKTEPKP